MVVCPVLQRVSCSRGLRPTSTGRTSTCKNVHRMYVRHRGEHSRYLHMLPPQATSDDSSAKHINAAETKGEPTTPGAAVTPDDTQATPPAVPSVQATSTPPETPPETTATTSASTSIRAPVTSVEEAVGAVGEAVGEAVEEAVEAVEEVVEAVEAVTEAVISEADAAGSEAATAVTEAVSSNAAVLSESGETDSTASSPESGPSSSAQEPDDLKLRLLAAVASLDRGIAANVREAREVDEVATKLEAAGGKVSLDWKARADRPDASPMELLAGTWRLIYSSGFNSGSLGGSRPGPPAVLVPLVLGQVYQRIDNNSAHLDNIVEFLFSFGLPPLPFGSSEPESPAVRLTLVHDFAVLGSNTVEIVYEDTAAEFLGSQLLDNFPKLAVPQLPEFLRPPRFLRSATFDVTYLDEVLRITRGDRGELRIYLKDQALTATAPPDYED